MGRPERFCPENTDGILFEVTSRVIGARALLSPAPNPRRFNELVIGLLGRALEHSPIELCAGVFAGNHYHLLVVVNDQQELSRFMQHFGCNSSKKIGKLRGWSGALWQRRYDAIQVSHEPEAQWNRLKYLLSHGVKEGLVESPMEWPGVHAAGALLRGEQLEGFWLSGTKECAARHRGQDYGACDFATKYRIGLAPVEIQAEGEAKRDGDPVAGVDKILSVNPYEPPTRRPKRSPKPRFHAASKQARDELWQDYAAFSTQFRMASEALRLGRNPEAIHWFPAGSYPPASPFIGEPPRPRPPMPPTRRITILESGRIERGEIPVVEIPVPVWLAEQRGREPPRVRGQPP